MLKLDLFDFYKQAKDNNILISFKGAFSQEILVEMGAVIRNKIGMNKKIKKIFSVFIELSQNIMHYSDERELINDKETGSGIIVFTESLKQFHILSGNIINSDKIEAIRNSIDNINSLNFEELKEAYSGQLRKPYDDTGKGAGLGLMEIVKKSQSQINYKINNIDETKSFLEISVNIDKD